MSCFICLNCLSVYLSHYYLYFYCLSVYLFFLLLLPLCVFLFSTTISSRYLFSTYIASLSISFFYFYCLYLFSTSIASIYFLLLLPLSIVYFYCIYFYCIFVYFSLHHLQSSFLFPRSLVILFGPFLCLVPDINIYDDLIKAEPNVKQASS